MSVRREGLILRRVSKEICFSLRLSTRWQSTWWLCCLRSCPACGMSPVTSGAVSGGRRVPHAWVSLCFTIRRKRNSPGDDVGFCREVRADRNPPPPAPPMAFPWGCPPPSRAAQGWGRVQEVQNQLLGAGRLRQQQREAAGHVLERAGSRQQAGGG